MLDPHPYRATSRTLASLTLFTSVINLSPSTSPKMPRVSFKKSMLRLDKSLLPDILPYFMICSC